MRKQKGITLIGMLLTTATVIIIAIVVLRIVPVYIQNFEVKSSLKALQSLDQTNFTDDRMVNASVLKNKLENQLYVNGIELKPEQIRITPQDDGSYKIELNYTVIKPLVYNVSLKFDFHELQEVKVGSN
ncbi:DUF4845 domain-containing protein [Legionella dresdenensis]|uniref:DUF4845 domain-containing protein n=1 Tax=Legionella dresdenensis TaxID=450200 RepID=A0ABV8CGL4_9GAMM